MIALSPNILRAFIQAYLADCQTRCEQSTVDFYSKRLQTLKDTLGHKPLAELTEQDILETLDKANHWPDGRAKAPDTVRANILSWQQLQKWLITQGHLPAALTATLKKPSGRKRELLPKNDETRAIIAHSKPDFVRIFRALRLTGARPGELAGARIRDINRAEGEIVLAKHKTANKTGKPRRIALGHPALIEILREAIGDRDEGHIFLRRNNAPWTTESLSAAFRTARKKAGLRDGLVLYLARHEHATTLYRETGDLKAVADALGHAQLTTTMRYTRVDSEQLKKSQRLFNEGLD